MKNNEFVHQYRKTTGHGTIYPVVFKEGKGVIITDIEGNEYIDFSSGFGVVNIGWQRQEILDTMKQQIDKSCFSIPWMPNEESIQLADKLLTLMPKHITKCIRASGGSDANEVAIRAIHSFRPGSFLSFKYSYHGGTSQMLSMSETQDFYFPKTPIQSNKDLKVFPPYCFHCVFDKMAGNCSFECLEALVQTIKSNPGITGMIIEPIIGSGGIIVPPENYLKELQNILTKHEIFLIVDEVLTGAGRTGPFFYFSHTGLLPDVVTVSKGITSGYMPLGAAILTSELADNLSKNYQDVTSTYSWTPLASKVAVTNIDMLNAASIRLNVQTMGKYLKKSLMSLFCQYLPANIGEIRGEGLMIGVELVKDQKLKLPADYLGKKILILARKKGLFIISNWIWHILVFLPPLIITQSDLDQGLSILEDVLKEVGNNQFQDHCQ